jgi:hypothetical protein
MTMMLHSPFEDANVQAFRGKLHAAARRIDKVLETHGFDAVDAALLKAMGNKFAKSGVLKDAKGDTLIDKITHGMPVSFMRRRSDFGKRRLDTNTQNKAAIAGYFEDTPGFDIERLAAGAPQSDNFRREAAAQLDALQSIAEIIYEPYHELATTEYKFYEKTNVFREFENREIGHYYSWQSVEDPFATEAPATQPVTHRELETSSGL